jgi:hypothetical protein
MTRTLPSLALLVGSLCGGCLVVPRTETKIRQAGTEDGPASLVASREVTVTAAVDGRTVHVQAKRIGECTQTVMAIDEVTKSKHAHLGGASDPRAAVFGILLAPVTIPISALVTTLAVAGASDETTRRPRPIGIKRFACSLEADHLPIAFTLPSGAKLELTTTHDGRADLEIPESEPYAGTISIAAPTAEPRDVAYAMPRPAITVLRDSVTECAAASGVTGNVTATLAISDSGRVTRVWLSAGDSAFNTCVARRVADVEFPASARGRTLAVPLALTAMR